MGPIQAVVLSNSGGGIVYLLVLLALSVLSFFAMAQIVRKAGYSQLWMLVPLTTVGLWIATEITLAFDVRTIVIGTTTVTGATSLGALPVLSALDFVSSVVTWLFFIIFAFSRWPVSNVGREPRRFDADPRSPFVPSGRPPPPDAAALAPTTPSSATPAGAAAGPASVSGPAVASPPARPEPPTAETGKVIYCSWCGNQRASDALAIHHCGSLDRPAVYCKNCGTSLEDRSTCASCGTPATNVSRS